MRNTILVTMDSLRADHCGHWGYHRDTTPTFDYMAEQGLTFENAMSPGPSTPESVPVSFTGEFPVRPVERANESSLLASRRRTIRRHVRVRETLAERFSRLGYSTSGFTPNPYTSRYFGLNEGFDYYEDFMGGSRERLYLGMLDGVLDSVSMASVLPIRLLLNWAQREEVFKPWEAFYDMLLQWVHRTEEPYFLWVLLMDTHDPYLVPDEYRTQSRWAMYHANVKLWQQGHQPPFSEATHDRLVRAYDDSIRYADDFLARLREDAPGDPLIAVHGDHGEAFGEHGTYGHHPQLYEENIHVPFVVSGGPSGTVQAPVSLRDLPDLLEMLAIDESIPRPNGLAVSQTLDEERIAARGRSWKYIWNGDDGDELYALGNGAHEGDQLDAPELREVTRSLTDRWREGHRERERISSAAAELREGPT